MPKEVLIARSAEEVRELGELWSSLPIDHPHADIDFFLEVIDVRREVLRPHVVIVLDRGRPIGLLAARLETIKLVTSFGYRAVFSPTVRALTIVPGGEVIVDHPAAQEISTSLLASLQRKEAEVVVLPSVRQDSALLAELTSSVSRFRRSHFAEVRTHRRLHLPSSFDDFMAARKRKIRAGVRYDGKRLEQKLGDRLRVDQFASPADLDRIFGDIVHISEMTYQRGLGASFADTPERRRLAELSLENGWFRAWVLYDEDKPIAFWQGSVYRGVYHSGTTGYDPAYGRDRVGIYLLMRVIAELCAEPETDTFDFGFGDAEYKRHFADEAWTELDVVIFGGTPRALTINAARAAVMGLETGARRAVERFGLDDRVKTWWRRRVRATSQSR